MLAFVDLVQDIDVLGPVLLDLAADPDLELRIVVSRWLEARSPRTALWLRRAGLPFRWVRRNDVVAGTAPGLQRVAAVLTASESSHPAHAAGHALASRAERSGIAAYTMQHGLENVGLHRAEGLGFRFASRAVFCWFEVGDADAAMAEETRAKLVSTGRPRPVLKPVAPTFDVAVFENLHGERYTDADRAAFLDGLEALAADGALVIVRPHPAGGWAGGLVQRFADRPAVTVQSPDHIAASLETAANVAASARRVITTPSTTALDALEAQRPVALAVAGGPIYAGLPVLASAKAWPAFVHGVAPAGLHTPPAMASLLTGDASTAILSRLRADLC